VYGRHKLLPREQEMVMDAKRLGQEVMDMAALASEYSERAEEYMAMYPDTKALAHAVFCQINGI
jgi:hypothetical protein